MCVCVEKKHEHTFFCPDDGLHSLTISVFVHVIQNNNNNNSLEYSCIWIRFYFYHQQQMAIETWKNWMKRCFFCFVLFCLFNLKCNRKDLFFDIFIYFGFISRRFFFCFITNFIIALVHFFPTTVSIHFRPLYSSSENYIVCFCQVNFAFFYLNDKIMNSIYF